MSWEMHAWGVKAFLAGLGFGLSIGVAGAVTVWFSL